MKQERENKRRSGVCKNTFLKSQKIPKQRIPKQFHVFRHVFGPSFSQERESRGEGGEEAACPYLQAIFPPQEHLVWKRSWPQHTANQTTGQALLTPTVALKTVFVPHSASSLQALPAGPAY